MSYQLLTIKSIKQETADTKSFVLQAEPHQPFIYQPGQFVTLIFPQSIRRSYSLSSHPTEGDPVITVKRIANGAASRRLFDEAKVGDAIPTIGASGFFTLPTERNAFDTIIMLAAGSGITPIMSLIKESLYSGRTEKLVLIYSNRSEHSTIFLDELKKLAANFPGKLHLEFFFSNNKNLNRARLGRLALEEMLSKYAGDPARTLYYLCGPHVYMQNITITLLTEGVPDDNIRREIFFNPLPAATHAPPDKDLHQVHVTYEGQRYTFAVQYPVSILKTALANGVMLPYSCEAGRCGTCAATCTNGEVWMLRNEVLLDKEMAAGRVLTCTGFAVGGDAELVIGK